MPRDDFAVRVYHDRNFEAKLFNARRHRVNRSVVLSRVALVRFQLAERLVYDLFAYIVYFALKCKTPPLGRGFAVLVIEFLLPNIGLF